MIIKRQSLRTGHKVPSREQDQKSLLDLVQQIEQRDKIKKDGNNGKREGKNRNVYNGGQKLGKQNRRKSERGKVRSSNSHKVLEPF